MKSILCFALLVLAVVASPMSAAVTPEESLVLDRWELQLGGFLTKLSTTIKFEETENRPPTEISFEDDLDFDDSDRIFRFSIARVFGKRHELRFSYFSLDRDSNVLFEREIEIGDEIIPIEADVLIFFDTDFATLDYTYWVVAGKRTAFGLTAGLTLFDLRAGFDVLDRNLPSVTLDINTDLPVPQIGLRFRQALTQKLIFLADGTFLRFRDIEDYSGDVLTTRLGLEHRTFRYLGFGAQFNFNNYEVRTGESRYNILFDYELEGFYIYLRGTFGGAKGK